MQRVKSVGVLSCAKMSGVIFGCLGLIIIPMALIGGLASFASGQKTAVAGAIGLMVVAILAPIFYAVMGFLLGAVQAFVYNLAAKWMGGIEIELEPPQAATSSQGIGLI